MKKILRIAAAALAGILLGLAAAYFFLPRFGINVAFLFRGILPAELHAPPGFTITVFHAGLSGPRFIAFGPDGALYAAERGAGRIVRLPDADGDGTADSVSVFAEGLDGPHSLAFHGGSWFIGLPAGVLRLADLNSDGRADEQEWVYESYSPGAHNTRTVLFLPDGRMLVALGSTCNVCEETDPQRAAVVAFPGAQGGEPAVFASGLRNAVGLALNPETGELWATNNGRDLLGDDLPPETVYIVREGGFYGWPVCHAGRIEDPDLGFPGSCEGVLAPEIELQAHSAPLGLVFYDGSAFPAEYQGDLFVAFHGSWNRSRPTGYKVVRIPIEDGRVAGPAEDFVWGWLSAFGFVTGRPVGLAVGPDGALYISDDYAGTIYRVVYQ